MDHMDHTPTTHPMSGEGRTFRLPLTGNQCPDCGGTPSAFEVDGPETWCPLCGATWVEGR